MPSKHPNPATVGEMLSRAAALLESRRDAELIAELTLWKSRAWLIAHDDAPVHAPERERFNALVEQRAGGVPMAYLAGTREFYGRKFRVGPAVLIPRPETEHLVEWALDLDLSASARVVDVGTGSGCIVLTLAAERPGWQCAGTDISAGALDVAAENRALLNVDQVRLLKGNLLEPVAETGLDLIVSNPPYVAAGDPHLEQGDVRFEPDVALTAGPNGLDLIAGLIDEARRKLAPGGWLLIEHGYDQAAAVRRLLRDHGYENIESRRDLAGIERVTGGRFRV